MDAIFFVIVFRRWDGNNTITHFYLKFMICIFKIMSIPKWSFGLLGVKTDQNFKVGNWSLSTHSISFILDIYALTKSVCEIHVIITNRRICTIFVVSKWSVWMSSNHIARLRGRQKFSPYVFKLNVVDRFNHSSHIIKLMFYPK